MAFALRACVENRAPLAVVRGDDDAKLPPQPVLIQGVIERAGKARFALAQLLQVPAVWPSILNAVKSLVAAAEPPKFVSEVDQWKHDLTTAGWIAETAFNWRAPDGSLWRGPAGAWKELQRRDAESPMTGFPDEACDGGADEVLAQIQMRVDSRAAASSSAPAEPPPNELPFDDYCAGAGDCRACKGINCTCPHHAPAAEPESLYATCRRVWVCKRCGNCLDHCKHKDESNFHEDLAMPCSVKTPAEPLQPEGEQECEVQCADCLTWINSNANHTCRQQVRRNQRSVK